MRGDNGNGESTSPLIAYRQSHCRSDLGLENEIRQVYDAFPALGSPNSDYRYSAPQGAKAVKKMRSGVFLFRFGPALLVGLSACGSGGHPSGGSTTGGSGGAGSCHTILSGAIALDSTMTCGIQIEGDADGGVGFEITTGSAQTAFTNFVCFFPAGFATGAFTNGTVSDAQTVVQGTASLGGDNAWAQEYNYPQQMNEGAFTLAVTSTGTNVGNMNHVWISSHGTLDASLIGSAENTTPGDVTLHIDF